MRSEVWLGNVFAFLTATAAFGIGNMVQANSVADAARASFGVPVWITGLVLALVTAVVVLGGIKRIAEVTQLLVPFMCLLYIFGTGIILIRFAGEVPGAAAERARRGLRQRAQHVCARIALARRPRVRDEDGRRAPRAGHSSRRRRRRVDAR